MRAERTPVFLLQARERSAQRLMMAYAIAGLFFMLLPGTFLGVWNLISISGHHSAAISASWIQAHGHAQIFGWIGTFIIGIGFYSIPKMSGRSSYSGARGWIAWALWITGVLLRWTTGVYQWHWRIALPVSAALELAAFLIFFFAVRQHPSAAHSGKAKGWPVWIVSVLVGTVGFGLGLLMNLAGTIYATLNSNALAFPAAFDNRLLALLAYAFIVPTIWGFSARWLPVFLGLKPINERMLKLALLLTTSGVVLTQAGLFHAAPWLFAIAAIVSVAAFHLVGRAERPAKTTGVHPSFPAFVRIAYAWFVIATLLGICAAYLDHSHGWVGGSRHALTVGFIAMMVFAIGQRILPAFAGMRVLYSTRLMLTCLLLLNLGCVLRVSSEILAYEGYWAPAWNALPWSAICELAAVTVFAANLLLTFKQPPAHEMKSAIA
ncbi:MAG TPA: NnrS family protein [Candidatus Angelobacter sp.]|nr:NnrS family protein [Candidatus Angelobacter sp.]